MKKITLLMLGIFISTIASGQEILSHSTNNTAGNATVACATDPDQTAGTGDEGISDNIYYRTYTPSDFGFTGDFEIMGGQTIFTYNDIGGSGVAGTGTLRFFTSDDVFPAGNLTEIASQAFEITAADDGAIVRQVLLETTTIVDSGTEIIIAFDLPAASGPPENVDYRISANADGEDSPSYLSSVGCGLTAPGTFASINFPNNHLILDLVGDEVLSVNDNTLAESISVYPNPTNGDLNINFARNLGTTNVDIINVNGQKVLNASIEGFGNNTIGTSKLANGIYFAQITSPEGSRTIKFIRN